MRGEKWRHLPHVGHAGSIPKADVAVEACVTATDSTETAVHILAQEVAHVRHERHLQDKTRAGYEGQGVALVIGKGVVSSIKNGCICVGVLTSQVLMSP
jgi:hypothetical protein